MSLRTFSVVSFYSGLKQLQKCPGTVVTGPRPCYYLFLFSVGDLLWNKDGFVGRLFLWICGSAQREYFLTVTHNKETLICSACQCPCCKYFCYGESRSSAVSIQGFFMIFKLSTSFLPQKFCYCFFLDQENSSLRLSPSSLYLTSFRPQL